MRLALFSSRRLPTLSARSHSIVSSTGGPDYYVNIMSFVDKSQARSRRRREVVSALTPRPA